MEPFRAIWSHFETVRPHFSMYTNDGLTTFGDPDGANDAVIKGTFEHGTVKHRWNVCNSQFASSVEVAARLINPVQ